MDTAAAAAAAVAVDLKPDQQLLGSSTKTRIGGGSTGCDCLGSTVETMSLTPPPTPPTRAIDGQVEACGAPGIPSAPAETHSLNGMKGKEAPETATAIASTEPTQPDTPATSSTSSAKASTTPTSALLGSGSATGSVVPAAEHPPAAAASVPSSSASNSSSSSSSSGSDGNVVQLLPWQDMPTYLQFNPYVLRGYRPLQTFKGCLLSLFYWHNETINILTHGEFRLPSTFHIRPFPTHLSPLA